MTALNYRDELEKASGSADNNARQIKDYLEDAASAKMAAEVDPPRECLAEAPH